METYSQFISEFNKWKQSYQDNYISTNRYIWLIPEHVKQNWKDMFTVSEELLTSVKGTFKMDNRLLGIENLRYSSEKTSKIKLFRLREIRSVELKIEDLLVTGIIKLETGVKDILLEGNITYSVTHPLEYSGIVLDYRDKEGNLLNRFKDYRITDDLGIILPEREEDYQNEFIKGTIDYLTGNLIIFRHNKENERRFTLKRNRGELDRITLTGTYSFYEGPAEKVFEFDTFLKDNSNRLTIKKEEKDVSEGLAEFMEKHAAYVRKKLGRIELSAEE